MCIQILLLLLLFKNICEEKIAKKKYERKYELKKIGGKTTTTKILPA